MLFSEDWKKLTGFSEVFTAFIIGVIGLSIYQKTIILTLAAMRT
jgi:hypothetical protein